MAASYSQPLSQICPKNVSPHMQYPIIHSNVEYIHGTPHLFPKHKAMLLQTENGEEHFNIDISEHEWKTRVYKCLKYWVSKTAQSQGFFEFEIEKEIDTPLQTGSTAKWFTCHIDIVSPVERWNSSHTMHCFSALQDFHWFIARKYQHMFPDYKLWLGNFNFHL